METAEKPHIGAHTSEGNNDVTGFERLFKFLGAFVVAKGANLVRTAHWNEIAPFTLGFEFISNPFNHIHKRRTIRFVQKDIGTENPVKKHVG